MNNPVSISSKLPQVPTSIFAIMSKMANDYGALNLSQGFPDFPVSEELIALVNKYMKAGLNQYSPMPGVLSLRGAISEKVKFLYGASYNAETEDTVTAGATQALYTAIMALVKEGDEVKDEVRIGVRELRGKAPEPTVRRLAGTAFQVFFHFIVLRREFRGLWAGSR